MKEICYIEYLCKDKNFKQVRKDFDEYDQAVSWAKENLEKFHPDMIKYDTVEIIN